MSRITAGEPAGAPHRRPSESSSPAVRIIKVAKRYGVVTAVEEVSLDILPGEFLTLLGPSGSGKTTLLQMVAGLAEPSAGEIWLGGREATRLPTHMRGIGMVFQNYALFPHMTVRENLAFPLKMRDVTEREVEERLRDILELVQLPTMESRGIGQLSGGQQQRVALARALVYRPSVLLMDEPLGALDKKLRDRMKLELKQIQQRVGMTVIYVTHDQDEALTMSDRIAVMRQGKVVQLGTPRDVYERPADAFVADFVGESNLLPGRLETVAAERCVVNVSCGPVHAAAGADLAVGSEVLMMVRPERIVFSARAGTIDNVFTGSVETVVYRGDSLLITVRLPGGLAVSLKRSALEADEIPAAGDSIRIGWAARHGVVLPRDNAA